MSDPYEGDAVGAAVGITGKSDAGYGVFGQSQKGKGVVGRNGLAEGPEQPDLGAGVWGDSTNGFGVFGGSQSAEGVYGATPIGSHAGVRGVNGFDSADAAAHPNPPQGCGVWGDSNEGYGVYGTSKSSDAGHFVGNVTVTGTINAHDLAFSGADFAEDFDSASGLPIDPGSVVTFEDDGSVRCSITSYERRVAGIVAGAGTYSPGIVLGREPGDHDAKRVPVALVGRVFCKVDATNAPIRVGDLLTSSDTPGHAMRCSNASAGFGAVIGKALGSQEAGFGLVPVLVSLQ
jgi:hypothetical protein